MSRVAPRRRRAPRASKSPVAGAPVVDLQHDHAALQQQVRALAVVVRRVERAPTPAARAACAAALASLREDLFLHFAREEEALLPFVVAKLPASAAAVAGLVAAHDAICGALARMVDAVRTGASVGAIFERFTTAYAGHAIREREVLAEVAAQVSARQRAALAALLRGV